MYDIIYIGDVYDLSLYRARRQLVKGDEPGAADPLRVGRPRRQVHVHAQRLLALCTCTCACPHA